jgi:hypothetical protein
VPLDDERGKHDLPMSTSPRQPAMMSATRRTNMTAATLRRTGRETARAATGLASRHHDGGDAHQQDCSQRLNERFATNPATPFGCRVRRVTVQAGAYTTSNRARHRRSPDGVMIPSRWVLCATASHYSPLRFSGDTRLFLAALRFVAVLMRRRIDSRRRHGWRLKCRREVTVLRCGANQLAGSSPRYLPANGPGPPPFVHGGLRPNVFPTSESSDVLHLTSRGFTKPREPTEGRRRGFHAH